MKVERGVPLVERIIEGVRPHVKVRGATAAQLDELESKLKVELPPTLRRYLEFDYSFDSFGTKWRGRGRFGSSPNNIQPRVTSVNKLAEAMTDLGWTPTRLKNRVLRLPNLPDHPWNCLYLGEPRRDGELPILGMVNDETNVMVFLRYTAFDLYLVEQSGLTELTDATRLDDVDTMLVLNRELRSLVPDEEPEPAF
jgi:hypothetical protein